MRTVFLLAVMACLVLLSSCSEDTVGPITNPIDTTETGIYTISGKLRFDSAIALPANPAVQVLWNVSSGSPDYMYVFGRGTVNMADSTFRVVFKTAPPAEAFNSYGLGVGAIALFADTVAEGKISEAATDTLEVKTLGLAENYAVIYLNRSPDSVAVGRSWAKDFKQGFNTGKGVEKDQGFDTFIPTEPNLIELVIDLYKRLRWVNWT